ncbi:hypothetical protein A9Q88_01245 [Gammaproteobacteria bacterium 50_400_T64]|nr:hypothetical protein A9Q88_01245 [Gammaproteobacteria bacterium 50_400_T64]
MAVSSTKAAVTTETVYLAGAINKERGLHSLTCLYLGVYIPYQAAVTLETAINKSRLKRMLNIWNYSARPGQARPGSRRAKAAALSGQGKIYAQLAAVYLGIGENDKAVRAAENALNKGKLKRPGAV